MSKSLFYYFVSIRPISIAANDAAKAAKPAPTDHDQAQLKPLLSGVLAAALLVLLTASARTRIIRIYLLALTLNCS